MAQADTRKGEGGKEGPLLTKLTKLRKGYWESWKILFSSTFVLLFLTCIEGFGQERSEAPVFSDGSFWQYRIVEHGEYMKSEKEMNGVYELLYSNGRFKTFKLEGNQKTERRIKRGREPFWVYAKRKGENHGINHILKNFSVDGGFALGGGSVAGLGTGKNYPRRLKRNAAAG
jgi:hypothetical protein